MDFRCQHFLKSVLKLVFLCFSAVVHAQFSFLPDPAALLNRQMASMMEFRITNGEEVSELWTFMANLDLAYGGDTEMEQLMKNAQGLLALGIPISSKFGSTVFGVVYPGFLYTGAGIFWYEEWLATAAGMAFENDTMYNGYNGSAVVPYLTAKVEMRGIIDEILTAFNYKFDTRLLDFIFAFNLLKYELPSNPGGVRFSIEHNAVLDTTTWAAKTDFRISQTTRLRTAAYVVSNKTAFTGFIDPSCWGFSIFFEPLAELSYTWKWLFGAMVDPIVGIVGVIGFSISLDSRLHKYGIRSSSRLGLGFKNGHMTFVDRIRDFIYFGDVKNTPIIPDIGP